MHRVVGSYAALAIRWDESASWVYDVVNGRIKTLDVGRVDEICTQEGITLALLETNWRHDEQMSALAHERRRMPATRHSFTHHCEIQDAELGAFDFYITAGEYDDGTLGEVFVKIGMKADTVQALVECWATSFSIALQHGADFEEQVRKFAGRKFSPFGPTDEPRIPYCTSIVDYVVQWLALRYGEVKLISDLQQERELRSEI